MKIFASFLAVSIFMAGASAAAAADHWVGAWGYDVSPEPPGTIGETLSPHNAKLALLLPMGMAPAPEPVPDYSKYRPVILNPGHLEFLSNATPLSGITVRQLVRVSVGGSQIRLRFTNEPGSDVMPLGVVHVAEADADGAIVPGTDHAVTFGGHPTVVIPASSPMLSDPVDMTVRPLEKLLISVVIPGELPHNGRAILMYATQTTGDYTAAVHLPDAKLAFISTLVSEVDVNAARPTKVLVTFGDSITEGVTSTMNAFHGWPDFLAERLAAAHKNWSVVNAGISGNRLVRYGAGPSALSRFDRDVLSVPGVKAVILMEGINDIGLSYSPEYARDPVTAQTLEDADKQIIARAHERGIKVYGALLTPYQGADYASAAGEKVRGELNNWIKTGGAFDGVLDFATPVADPANPLAILPKYNIADHLHPNDAGYKAMADSIDLDLITK
jgi:lysophospholipase L1-like esterase